MEETNNKINFNLKSLFFVAALLIFAIGSYLVFSYIGNQKSKEVNVSKKTDAKPFEVIRSDESLEIADNLYRQGDSKGAYDKFLEVLKTKDFADNKNLLQTTKLYKTAALLGFDREAAFKEYYEFYKDQNNTLENRAYALLMAQQSTVAFNDPKKILFVLNENEARDIKTLDNKNIQYAISKKIFAFFPFPITAARMASFEVDNLDPKNPKSKKLAEEIYTKYMFNFDKNLEYMESIEGLRHLVSNSLASRGNLSSKLEVYGVTNSKTVTDLYENAILKAELYSPRGTKHFLMASYLEYCVKTNKQDKIDKLLIAFTDEKNKNSINENVLKNLTVESRMGTAYPFVFARYQKDIDFKNKIIAIFGQSK